MRKHKARVEVGAVSNTVILQENVQRREEVGALVEAADGARARVVPHAAVLPPICVWEKVRV